MDIESLREKAQKAQHELWRAEAKERDKINAAMVGRYFKYHNSGGGCDKPWWLYLTITTVSDGNLEGFQFQVLPDGRVEIEPKHYVFHGRFAGNGIGGYIEIEKDEFDTAWRALVHLVDGWPLYGRRIINA